MKGGRDGSESLDTTVVMGTQSLIKGKTMDINKEIPPDAWGSIERLVEMGQHPDPKVLAEKLRGDYPIPAAVRAYLADLIERKIRRPRGRPPLPRSSGW